MGVPEINKTKLVLTGTISRGAFYKPMARRVIKVTAIVI
jgi:hypothetical protein